ncbi:1233_t:CDS:2, partial [Gigaspora margarita]
MYLKEIKKNVKRNLEKLEHQEHGINCEQPFPRTQEDFENSRQKLLILIGNLKQAMMNISIKTTSLLACMYCKKLYDHCKKHEEYKCDYYDLSLFCDLCNKTCERKPARWGRGKLSEEITGPFEFGKFCEIEKYTKVLLRSKEYKDEEYESIIEGNKMLIEGAHSLEVFKHNAEK